MERNTKGSEMNDHHTDPKNLPKASKQNSVDVDGETWHLRSALIRWVATRYSDGLWLIVPRTGRSNADKQNAVNEIRAKLGA
jgi:hypothetical protein